MSELLKSVRADLTDRRLLPAVALVSVCLAAALAYALLGGSSGEATPSASTAPAPRGPSGIAVTAVAPEHAVAETTDGLKQQNAGTSRDPFLLLAGTGRSPGASAATGSPSTSSSGSSASSGSSSSSSTGKSGSGATSGSGGSGETSNSETKTETKKPSKKPATVYDVAIEFGLLPPGTTPEAAQLTPFTKLKLSTLLPSAQQPLLAFRGVTAKGKSATFQLVSEAILSGTGACLPSPAQCEAVDLKPGETEQLDYLAADGQTIVYELRVTGITSAKAQAARAKTAAWGESKAGRELLRHSGLVALPFLRYSSQPGVLVFAPRKAHAALARTAVITSAG